jgi:7,8-dihydroneopterin aldolase/epimerase/oxygenase
MSHPEAAGGEDRFAPDAQRQQRLVFIRGLEMQARLGVHAHEKRAPQRIVVGVELVVEDPWAPGGVGPDELNRVVDYEKLVNLARSEVAAGHVLLVETLAERLATAALVDPRVRRVRVSIEKPEAFTDVASVGVVVERRRA